jgi:uncharacterized protein YciU (UPF0263 family)
MYISDTDKQRILDASSSKLVEVISEFSPLHKSGVSFVGKCPNCDEERGLNVTPGKSIFKCFKCNGLSGKTPVDYLMKGQNMTFPQALEYLAQKCHIIIDDKKPASKPEVKVSKKGKEPDEEAKSYCRRMLAESGLTPKDVIAHIFKQNDNSTVAIGPTFHRGTIDQFGNIDSKGDDVIIEYYNLDGFPITYAQKDRKGKETGKIKEYFRVRWQFPDEHKDKEGKPYKYKSPVGSGTYIYIPEVIRAMFKAGTLIERLYIQEGEKKAEKACKHGIPSIAISGIQNLGINGRVPEDLIRIIQTCGVKEVCFLLDADWNDLSTELRVNDQVEKRPRNFFYAVKNYKEYMRSLKNREIYVEIYFGYVKPNNEHDKGIDDLLANTLKGREDELKTDIDYLINEKNLSGKYLQLHKITVFTDHKLQELWGLHNPKVFADMHYEVLKDMPEFTFGRHKWQFNENRELESTQPIESDEQFWQKNEKFDKSGNAYTTYEFKYVRSQRFLLNRGIGRHMLLDGKSFEFIYINQQFVRTLEAWEVRDFLFEFARVNCSEDVNEMLLKGGTQYLGPDKLSSLLFLEPNFTLPEREKQLFYFQKKCWEITERSISEIDYTSVTHHIWHDARKNFPAKLTLPLISVSKSDDGIYNYTLSDEGQNCHFLKFLINTSNFTWRKENMLKDNPDSSTEVDITPEELNENRQHLIAKLCAIGYMVMDNKDRSTAKAVVAMDGRQSEVGSSFGRSGKSIVGEALKHIAPTVYINGKKTDMSTDQFLWDGITEKTRSAFIDDVRPGFDFESLFANITGDWAVNYKGGRRCTFPFATSPKIYITTNHALNGEGSSFKDRQWLVAFSDFYNDEHKPIHDFGTLFFDEWDFEQWNLFWNLMALCVQLYLRYGVVESPGERLEARILRQQIGENFILWADEYFSAKEHINQRINRKDMNDKYFEMFPNDRKYVSATIFKKRVKKYCTWKGYTFNPQRFDPTNGTPLFLDKDGKPDIDDKSGGIEYFTIGDDTYFNQQYSSPELNLDMNNQEEDDPFLSKP